MKPCKHLDFTEGKYGSDIEICTVSVNDDFGEPVRYWHRGETWTNNGPNQKPNPARVQFCGAGRGRINEIFACYGEMHCYEPSEQTN